MSDGGSGDDWASSEAKDWKDGRHKRENEYVLPHAGQIEDRDTDEMLTVLELVYQRAHERGWLGDGWPASVQDLSDYRELRTVAESETFARRVDEGAGAQLRQHVGSQTDEVDVSGWDDIERIRSVVGQHPLMLYIFGNPGTGKTAASLRAARHHVLQVEDATDDRVEIGTNIRTAVEQTERIDRWVRNWADLKGWMIEDEETVLAGGAKPKIFIFDEASSHASGGGEDGYQTAAKLAVLCYKIRKYGGSIIIIGHDGKDLHPAVREMCTVLHKTEKKDGRFYESVKNRTGKDPITPPISGWPDTKWSYNDKDPADWSWSDSNDEETPESAENGITRELAYDEFAIWSVVKEREKEDPLSFEKIAARKLQGHRSGEWCRKKWKAYQNGEHRDIVARLDEGIA